MPLSDLIIPTKRLYQQPAFDDYEKIRNNWIKQIAPNYEAKPLTERWDLLISEFKKHASDNTDDPMIKAQVNVLFDQFRNARKTVEVNENVMQLDQCIFYFENFYFLYLNEENHYRLPAQRKKKLLEGVIDVMGPVCEPGKITRCQDILQQYRNDINWIATQLYQQRCNVIQRLADEYNQTHDVGGAMSVHTVLKMQKLAHIAQLGIVPDHEIRDVYMGNMDSASIKAFFERHVSERFAGFERAVNSNLANHVMSELSQWIAHTKQVSLEWMSPTELRQRVQSQLTEWETNGLNSLKGLEEEEKKKLITEFGTLTTSLVDEAELQIRADISNWLMQNAHITPSDAGKIEEQINHPTKDTFELGNQQFIEFQKYFIKVMSEHNRNVVMQIHQWLSKHQITNYNEGDLTLNNEQKYRLKKLNELAMTEWETRGLSLYHEQQVKFKEFINNLFGKLEVNIGNTPLDEFFTVFGLDKKENVFKTIEYLIPKKLIEDNFFVNFSAVDPKNIQDDDLFLPDGITTKRLFRFINAIKVIDEQQDPLTYVTKIVQKNQKICIHYPDLLAELVIKNPSFWFYFPKSIKNNAHVLDKCIKPLTNSLLKLKNGDENKLTELLLNSKNKNQLVKLLQSEDVEKVAKVVRLLEIETFCQTENNAVEECDINDEELTQLFLTSKQEEETRIGDSLSAIIKAVPFYPLPKELMKNKSIVLQLVSKNGLLLQQAAPELQEDNEVVQASMNQNPKAYYFATGSKKELLELCAELQRSLPGGLTHRFRPISPENADYWAANLIKLQSIYNLYRSAHISTTKLANLAQHITPEELLLIMEARKVVELPPFPNCDENTLKDFFEQTNKELWRNQGYWEVKREIDGNNHSSFHLYLSTKYYRNLASSSIASSSNWFLGFMAYQNELPTYFMPFHSFKDILKQLHITLRSLGSFILSFGAIAFDLLKTFTNVILPFLLYVGIEIIQELLLESMKKGVEYLLTINGLIYPIIFLQTLLYTLIIRSIFGVDDPFTLFFLSAALVVLQTVFPTLIVSMASFLALFAAYSVAALIFRGELSWISILQVVLYNYYNLPATIGLTLVEGAITLFTDLYTAATLMLATIVPWITRSFTTIFSSPSTSPSPEENLIINIEESIFRLKTSEDPSAIQKGTMLEILWDKICNEVTNSQGRITFGQALNKQYSFKEDEQMEASLPLNEEEEAQEEVEATPKTTSFWEVANTRRSSADFKLKTNSHYSFFGIEKTTTAKQIERHVDFSHEAPAA